MAELNARVAVRFIDVLLVFSIVMLGFWMFLAPGSGDSYMDMWGDELPVNPPKMLSEEVREVSAGWSHSCAVLSDDTLECWG